MVSEYGREMLEKVEKAGIDPYPYEFDVSEMLHKIKQNPEEGKEYSTAGRVMAIREMGKLVFADISNSYDKLQISLNASIIGPDKIREFLKIVNIGDIINVRGELFRSKRGELTIQVREFKILAKCLRKLPDKWHGMTNIETRYRKRYLDFIMSRESAKVFLIKSRIIRNIRHLLDSREFVEVETPIIQPVYGGANATPFITFVKDLKKNMYLQISPELYLKRYIIGGFERVYSITKNFRNESIDSTHNPEFTMLEAYQSYADYTDIMDLTEQIIKAAIDALPEGMRPDISFPFKRVTMSEAIRQHLGIDVDSMDSDEVREYMEAEGIELPTPYSRGLGIAEIFESKVQPLLGEPTFVIDHPKETTPLCKPHRKNPELVERFELFISGMEIANAYTELNDPVIQRRMFEEQIERRLHGDEEAHPLDEDFLEAMEYAMPPTGGLGIGIDRLAMLLTGRKSIKDVIPFPMMK